MHAKRYCATATLSITHKLSSKNEAELDVGEAGHPPPHDGVSWRWIFGACEVASEAGEFGQIQGELIAGGRGTGYVAHQLIQQVDLSWRQRHLRRSLWPGPVQHRHPEDSPAEQAQDRDKIHEPFGGA